LALNKVLIVVVDVAPSVVQSLALLPDSPDYDVLAFGLPIFIVIPLERWVRSFEVYCIKKTIQVFACFKTGAVRMLLAGDGRCLVASTGPPAPMGQRT
jgi:hypothetical protein